MKQALVRTAKKLLPAGIKKSIYGFGYNIAPETHKEFSFNYGYTADMEHGLKAIAERGYSPKTILDIGSFHGDWARLAKSVWPQANLLMIEGNTEKEALLKQVANDLNARLEIALLGRTDGEAVEFHVMESGSSVFEENSSINRRKETRTLRRLDKLLQDAPAPDFIKLDTQGFELEILRGAEDILPSVSAILMEVSLMEINKGAPILDEVISFMKKRDFIAYEVMEIHRRPTDRAMNQIDIFFVRPNSPLLKDKAFM